MARKAATLALILTVTACSAGAKAWPTMSGHAISITAVCLTEIRGDVRGERLDHFFGVGKSKALSSAEIQQMLHSLGGIVVRYAGRSITNAYFPSVGISEQSEIPVYAEAAFDHSSTVYFETTASRKFAHGDSHITTMWIPSDLQEGSYDLCAR